MTMEVAFLAGVLAGLAVALPALRRLRNKLNQAQADTNRLMEVAYYLGVHAQQRKQQRLSSERA